MAGGPVYWLIVLLALAWTARAGEPASAYWPLAKGTSWVYEGEVKWVEGDSSKGTSHVMTTNLTWRVEVTETFEAYHVFAARLRGFPWDLAWYKTGKEPGDHLILRVGAGHYHHFSGDRVGSLLQKLRQQQESHVACLEELSAQNLLVEAPFLEGKHYGDFANTPRDIYCWVVGAGRAFNPRSVEGCPKLVRPEEFAVSYRSNPDHVFFRFVPGLGITSFMYGHHGTTSEANVRLVRYDAGGP